MTDGIDGPKLEAAFPLGSGFRSADEVFGRHNQMKLLSLHITNFRGLTDVAFDFDQATNVIVGPNAVGKTTVLEAVRLAKALLSPRYFQEGQQVLASLGAMSSNVP